MYVNRVFFVAINSVKNAHKVVYLLLDQSAVGVRLLYLYSTCARLLYAQVHVHVASCRSQESDLPLPSSVSSLAIDHCLVKCSNFLKFAVFTSLLVCCTPHFPVDFIWCWCCLCLSLANTCTCACVTLCMCFSLLLVLAYLLHVKSYLCCSIS